MLKVLILKNEIKPGFLYKIKSLFAKNEIYHEIKHLGNTQINYITIKRKKLSIPWDEIKYLWGGDAKNILCDETLQLPENLGFSQFNDRKFLEKLCINSANYVIHNLNCNPENLKVTLYDPFCEYHHILENIIMFSRHIKVVTNQQDVYLNNIKTLSDDYGVSIPISNKLSWISPCNILIAPKVDAKFYTSSSTVIFTTENNTLGLNGIIFNKYKLDVCDEIKKLIPNKISTERFLAGLYGTKKFLKLGQIVPDYCISGGKTISINEISKFISTS